MEAKVIITTELQLKAIIADAVNAALKYHQPSQQPAEEIGGIELAEQITRLSKDRIYALVSQRSIPHKKRGNRLYFSRSELLAWVEVGNRQERKGGRKTA